SSRYPRSATAACWAALSRAFLGVSAPCSTAAIACPTSVDSSGYASMVGRACLALARFSKNFCSPGYWLQASANSLLPCSEERSGRLPLGRFHLTSISLLVNHCRNAREAPARLGSEWLNSTHTSGPEIVSWSPLNPGRYAMP